ncbi:MAG: hypothetical protein HYZ58_07775 [Acidobacteria bacterium]|nr:hypothetical protein [Acidobacteriota bacterium]MBI3263034.1 hypothetical protein [Acidobacteriota bacterium]
MRLFARNSREWLTSLAGVVLVVLCLALANPEVRDDIFSVRRAFHAREVTAWAAEGGAMADEATGWMRAIVMSQAPLVIFALASLVLVLLTLRL